MKSRLNVPGGDEDQMMVAVNTTPLVDVMLVLLIIFLITIPVVLQTVPVSLPKERNVPTQSKPENLVLSVDEKGDTYLNTLQIKSSGELLDILRKIAKKDPQPEVHIRGDEDAEYTPFGRIVLACQRVGIAKISFITEPPSR